VTALSARSVLSCRVISILTSQATDTELIVAWTSAEYELYVALGPRVSRPAALAACAKLRSFLKKEERSLFLTSPPTITGNKSQ